MLTRLPETIEELQDYNEAIYYYRGPSYQFLDWLSGNIWANIENHIGNLLRWCPYTARNFRRYSREFERLGIEPKWTEERALIEEPVYHNIVIQHKYGYTCTLKYYYQGGVIKTHTSITVCEELKSKRVIYVWKSVNYYSNTKSSV